MIVLKCFAVNGIYSQFTCTLSVGVAQLQCLGWGEVRLHSKRELFFDAVRIMSRINLCHQWYLRFDLQSSRCDNQV